ncbi:MAG: hypothetical protein K8R41_06945 [Bacteroidales bacterium]|nr:hypothetical protein [Bacteroidales bacterium]
MNREILINRTIDNIHLLPDWRLKEISDYIDFLLKSFDFLNDEDDLYNETDLIEKYQ